VIRKIGGMLARGLDAVELEVFLGITGLIVVALLAMGLAMGLAALVWRFA
jgi:hypothetical protein